MARTRVRSYRVKLSPGGAPRIELIDGDRVVGECYFEVRVGVDRLVRDPETDFIELTFDPGQYERVLDMLRNESNVWVDDEPARLLGL